MITRIVTDQYPLFLPPPKTPRSTGVHVSNIIRCIATEAGLLKPEWVEELSLVDAREIKDPASILRISIGLAVEQYYIPEILEKYGVLDHPGEMEYDGVYMTHDGEDLSVVLVPVGAYYGTPASRKRYVPRVHEVKATYKSTRTVGDLTTDANWMWLAQIKAYCIALGTRFAVLHVWFLCGDYSFPITPVREVWELEFTQQELDDNWSLLRDYKEQKLQSRKQLNLGLGASNTTVFLP